MSKPWSYKEERPGVYSIILTFNGMVKATVYTEEDAKWFTSIANSHTVGGYDEDEETT